LTCRLVFADWLEERHHEPGCPIKAEFMRLWCRLIELPESDPTKSTLRERYESIYSQLDPVWRFQVDGEAVRLQLDQAKSIALDYLAEKFKLTIFPEDELTLPYPWEYTEPDWHMSYPAYYPYDRGDAPPQADLIVTRIGKVVDAGSHS
jgi:uncharacterized protein (TIGR02996 family)